MKLTRKKAIQISIELWTWLVKTGANFKREWSGWGKYGMMQCACPLCEYAWRGTPLGIPNCKRCPYFKKFGFCSNGFWLYPKRGTTIFDHWLNAKTVEDRKKYAKQFLAQLKELK